MISFCGNFHSTSGPPGRVQPKANFTQNSCTQCGPGRFDPQPDKPDIIRRVCRFCPASKFQRSNASTSCNLCSAGSIAPNRGAHTCSKCPKGYYDAEDDPKRAIECRRCQAGRFEKAAGSVQCKSCPPGLYSSLSRDACSSTLTCYPGSSCSTLFSRTAL